MSSNETMGTEMRAAMGEQIRNNLVPQIMEIAKQYGVSFSEILDQIRHQQDLQATEEAETALNQAANPRE